MPFSLLFAASLLLHGKPISQQPNSHQPNSHHSASRLSSRRRLCPARVSLHSSEAVTAVKGDIQFVTTVPATASPSPVMPRKVPYSPNPRIQEEGEEQDLIDAINAERRERGLQTLTPDPLLTETARAHSREMCDRGYFDHRSPIAEEKTPLDRYLKSLHDWGEDQPTRVIVGENLFFCSATSPTYNVAYAHASLMNSPGHRANILEARFTKVGVGLYRDSQGQFWVTELFLRDE